MIKYEVLAKGTATKGYYLTAEKYFNGKQIESYIFDSVLSGLISMSKERYRDLLWKNFNCIFDRDKESYFKYKSDCEAAARWLQNKLNREEDYMSKQGLVLRKEERKRLTFKDLEPGELFIRWKDDIIRRKLVENDLLKEAGYKGCYVVESGINIGKTYIISENEYVERVKLVNNECVYV